MADNPEERLRNFVNSSGFPLQIGIRHVVESSDRDQKWGVLTEEHPWENQISGESGFIDLVLDHHDKTQILIVECKRVKDSQWIFLTPSNNSIQCTRAKSWTTYGSKCFGWMDLSLEPVSFESSFCVVPGQDAKSKPMLERLASDVVEATEAFAREERFLEIFAEYHLRTYFSVIVTTADLKICRFDPEKIDIGLGEITKCEFESVSSIRFRKPLTPRNEEVSKGDITKVFQEKERTVFVVNSLSFLDFITNWRLGPLPRALEQ